MAAMPNWNGAQGQLGEPLEAPAPRRRWRAEVGGRPALAIEAQMSSPREAAVVGERLRRLQARPDPRLTQLLGWAVEGDAAWVLLAGEEGGRRTLGDLLRSGPLSPPEAAAVAWSVLSALEAMHEAGIAHGAVGTDSVLVDRSGAVRLDGGWFVPEARSGSDQMVADIEAAGAAGLAALGMHEASGGPATQAELTAPALARMMRAIAAGASGSNVAGARMALTATAGSMVDPEGLARARALLARRAGGEEMPALPPPSRPALPAPASAAPAAVARPPAAVPAPRPVAPVPAAPLPARPRPPEDLAEPSPAPAPAIPARHYVATAADFEGLDRGFGRGLGQRFGPGLGESFRQRFQGFGRGLGQEFDVGRLAVPLIVAGALIVVAAMGWFAIGSISHARSAATNAPAASTHPSAAATHAPAANPTPTSAGTPTPKPEPSFGPPSAAPVKSVAMQAPGCAPGGSCTAEIVVTTSSAPAANDISWVVRAYDACTGSTTDVGTGHFTEQQGWTSIDVSTPVRLPQARGQLLISAVTQAPATAASPPLTLGNPGC